MKILREGNPNGWETQKECTGEGNGGGGCTALLLVNENDISAKLISDYSGDFDDYCYSFKCPCCETITDICKKEIPGRVRAKAIKKYLQEKNERNDI